MGVDDHDTFTGLTPLQSAAHDGNIGKVIELLDAGADLNIQANGEVRRLPHSAAFRITLQNLSPSAAYARTHARVRDLRLPRPRWKAADPPLFFSKPIVIPFQHSRIVAGLSLSLSRPAPRILPSHALFLSSSSSKTLPATQTATERRQDGGDARSRRGKH
jgi:hypothetical protein